MTQARVKRRLRSPRLLWACGVLIALAAIAGLCLAWRDAALTVDTPTRLHGRVRKHGPLGVVSMLAAGGTYQQLRFPGGWRKRRLAGEQPRPPAKWCSVMYSDKYRLIFVKTPKTAGTTLATFFTDCRVPGAADHCLRMAAYGNASNVAHIAAAWNDYFVFGFSRNPLRRAISQYQYLSTFISPECGEAPSWDAFCADPFVLGDLCADRNRSERCCTEMTVDEAEHHYLHASPQANCFTTLDGRLALDWLGRVESFEDDLAELLVTLNSRPGVPKIPARPPRKANYNASPCEPGGGSSRQKNQAHRRLAWQLRNGTAHPCDKMELFRGRHAACYTGVTSFFQEDIALLM